MIGYPELAFYDLYADLEDYSDLEYQRYLLVEQDIVVGVAVIYATDRYDGGIPEGLAGLAYCISLFEIVEGRRGEGLGSKFLELIDARLDHKPLILLSLEEALPFWYTMGFNSEEGEEPWLIRR